MRRTSSTCRSGWDTLTSPLPAFTTGQDAARGQSNVSCEVLKSTLDTVTFHLFEILQEYRMQTELPRIHVGQDNETEIDLLGFDVHANLIRSVITDPTVLPVTVGVFGDWGGGKSSIMKMLQKELSDEDAYPAVVCLYFNGWTFEGYEDAKSALLSSILIQLGEHKRFGPKAKDWVVKLLKRLKWMEMGKLAVKHVGIPVAIAAATGGIAAVPVAAAAVASAVASSAMGKKDDDDDSNDINWSSLIEASPEKPDL